MKTIVFLTGSYFPDHSAVSNCIERVILQLEESFNVIVICPQTSTEQLLNEKHENHTIMRFRNKDIENKISRKMKRMFNRYSLLDNLVDGYLSEMEKIDNIDTIFPSIMPFETALAAMNLKEKNKKVNIVPFMFDPYSNNSNLHYNDVIKKIKSKSLMKLEKGLLENSQYIIFIHHLKEYFDKNYSKYKKKFVFIEHPLFEKKEYFIDNQKNDTDDINLVYTGSFYKKIRNPNYFLDIMDKVINKKNNLFVHLYHFGDCKKVIKKWSALNSNIIDYGSVNSNIAREKMQRADVLIGVGNLTNSQTPSKIFEYISFKKKIIYFYKNKNDRNIDILKKYPYSLIIDESKGDINENIKKIIHFLELKVISNSDVNDKINILFNDANPNYISEIIIDKMAK